MSDKKQICIIDDHPVFRKGLAQLINEENDLRVVGEADTVDSGIQLVENVRPDLAIVDITLEDRSGLDLIDHITRYSPGIAILVISMHDESLYAERVLRAGALGYITKQEMTNNVVSAIRRVITGKRYVSASVMDTLLGKLSTGASDQDTDPIETLSNRELEVFQLIGRGFKRQEIADRLHLSVKTIGTYRESLKRKLSLKTAAELMKHAVNFVQKNPG